MSFSLIILEGCMREQISRTILRVGYRETGVYEPSRNLFNESDHDSFQLGFTS